MKCKYEHDGDCCNMGAEQYMCKCKQLCGCIAPLTNADRIRGMSDDELAEKLLTINDFDEKWCKRKRSCDDRVENDEPIPDEECMECMLDWLKKPWEGV